MKPLTKWLAWYGARVFLLYSLLVLAFYGLRAVNGFAWVQIIEARALYTVLSSFYPGLSLSGATISNIVLNGAYTSVSVSVIDLCIGYFPIAAFASMVAGIPKAKRSQVLYSLAVGLPVLFALNLARMLALFFVGAGYGAEAFDLWHLFIVSYDLLFFVVLAFVFCIALFFGRDFLRESIESVSNSKARLI